MLYLLFTNSISMSYKDIHLKAVIHAVPSNLLKHHTLLNTRHLSFAHAGIEGRYSSHPLFKIEVLPFSAQISISSWQITGENVWPEDRQKRNSFTLSNNMKCYMLLDNILFQH